MSSNRLPVLAAEIRRAHADVHEAAKTAAERAIEAGCSLIEAKSLLKHGEWLPWLKEHCKLPERTAQFYMKIAKLGLKPATVADLGLKAAAQAIVLQYPDPFAGESEEVLREWALYMLFGIQAHHVPPQSIEQHCHWLKRNGWGTPSEWFSDEADRYRERRGLRQPPEQHRTRWAKFLDENRSRELPALEAELRRHAAAEALS